MAELKIVTAYVFRRYTVMFVSSPQCVPLRMSYPFVIFTQTGSRDDPFVNGPYRIVLHCPRRNGNPRLPLPSRVSITV